MWYFFPPISQLTAVANIRKKSHLHIIGRRQWWSWWEKFMLCLLLCYSGHSISPVSKLSNVLYWSPTMVMLPTFLLFQMNIIWNALLYEHLNLSSVTEELMMRKMIFSYAIRWWDRGPLSECMINSGWSPNTQDSFHSTFLSCSHIFSRPASSLFLAEKKKLRKEEHMFFLKDDSLFISSFLFFFHWWFLCASENIAEDEKK